MKYLIIAFIFFFLWSCEQVDVDPTPTDNTKPITWTWLDPYSAPGEPLYSVLEFYPDGTVFVSYKLRKTEMVTEVGLFEYLPYKGGYLIFQKNGPADTYAQKSQLKDGKLIFGGRTYELETQ